LAIKMLLNIGMKQKMLLKDMNSFETY
jgi:hypothetical protein